MAGDPSGELSILHQPHFGLDGAGFLDRLENGDHVPGSRPDGVQALDTSPTVAPSTKEKEAFSSSTLTSV